MPEEEQGVEEDRGSPEAGEAPTPAAEDAGPVAAEPAAPDSVSDDDMIVCVDEDGEFYDLVKELGIGRSRRWLLAAAIILILVAGAAAAAFFILNR